MQSPDSFMSVLIPMRPLDWIIDTLLDDIRKQFRGGIFGGYTPATCKFALRVKEPAAEISRLSEIIQRVFQIKESSPEIKQSSEVKQQKSQNNKTENEPALIPYIFKVYDTGAFSIKDLFKPDDGFGGFFHGTCFITWLEKGHNGSAYWTDGSGTCTLEDNRFLKCDRGKMEAKDQEKIGGVGGTFLAFVNRISRSGEE